MIPVIRDRIPVEQWQNHFETLFQDNTRNDNFDDIIQDDDTNEEIQYCVTDDELEDIIFNSEITNEEILKSVQSLKHGKSAGIDEVIPEFFIHSIGIILPLLNRFLIECLTMLSSQRHGVIQLL